MSFTERAGLIPVLLLTGCASPATVTTPPSTDSVVDQYLSRSAADISAMQYRIHQTGPSAQRPGLTHSSVNRSSLLTQAPAPLSGLSNAKRSASLPRGPESAGPADGFVRQGGAAPTLRSALRKIVPPGYAFAFGKTVPADAPELWRWGGNDRWPYVVDKLLAGRGLKATVNAQTKMVTIESTKSAQPSRAPSIPTSSPVPAASPSKSTTPKLLNGPVTPVPSVPLILSKGQKAPETSPKPVVQPAPVLKTWKLEKGSSLKKGWMAWVDKETCPSASNKKWEVRWETLTDYPIDDLLTFTVSNFEEATEQLFNLYRKAKIPLYVDGYRPQCLIVISETKKE